MGDHEMKRGPNRNASLMPRQSLAQHTGEGPDPLQFVPVRLRRLRLAADLTQRELAELVGTSNATISEYESLEHSDIPLRLLHRICRVYEITLTRFFADWSVGVPYVDREKIREKLAA